MQSKDIDWNDLRYVLMLAQHQTMVAAAEALRVHQTTISRRILALEQRLQLRLFDRIDGRFAPTSRGMVVVRPTVELGPRNRLELRVGKFQRICAGAIYHTAGAHQPSHRNNNQSTRAGSEDVNAVESHLHRGHVTP